MKHAPRNERAIRAKGVRSARRVVFLAVPPVEELDIVGPWEVFTTANNVLSGKQPAYHIELVTTGRGMTFSGDSGLTMTAKRHYSALGGDIDTVIVPGGTGPRVGSDGKLLDWLRKSAMNIHRMASVCTGAFLLAQAGLLDGRRATTHWMFAKELARRYARITVDPERIYVRDGHIYTSAGVTAGMDLALALVEEDFGSAIAWQVARLLVLFLRRPGGQAQFSTLLSCQASSSQPLRELQVWIAANLQRDLSVDMLASRVAMSPRNFARAFVREIGLTPARLIERLRVEEARRDLETTDHGLERVAAAAGFSSAEVMRRAFHRCIGVSPKAYRLRLGHLSSPADPAG